MPLRAPRASSRARARARARCAVQRRAARGPPAGRRELQGQPVRDHHTKNKRCTYPIAIQYHHFLNLCRYETTIFTIASAITKLSRVTGVPENRRLWRGLGGMILPEQFWRRFAECYAAFRVEAAEPEPTRAAVEAVRKAVRGLVKRPQSEVHKELSVEFLTLTAPSDRRAGAAGAAAAEMQVLLAAITPPPQDGQAAAPPPGAAEFKVLSSDPADAGLAMTVALPMSKFDFRQPVRRAFCEAVERLCRPTARVRVEIQDVADKPDDFCGGGACPPVRTPSTAQTAIPLVTSDQPCDIDAVLCHCVHDSKVSTELTLPCRVVRWKCNVCTGSRFVRHAARCLHAPLYPSLSRLPPVEYGFLSTTTARETAFQYSGVDKRRGIVFEIQAGRVDIGASIQARSSLRSANKEAGRLIFDSYALWPCLLCAAVAWV